MTSIIVAIQDSAIESYGPPFFVRTEMEAKRMFADEANNTDSRVYKHPADFILFKIGMYNESTGEVQGMTPSQIARATDLIKDTTK